MEKIIRVFLLSGFLAIAKSKMIDIDREDAGQLVAGGVESTIIGHFPSVS